MDIKSQVHINDRFIERKYVEWIIQQNENHVDWSHKIESRRYKSRRHVDVKKINVWNTL